MSNILLIALLTVVSSIGMSASMPTIDAQLSGDLISPMANLRLKRELLKELLGVDLPIVPGVVGVSLIHFKPL